MVDGRAALQKMLTGGVVAGERVRDAERARLVVAAFDGLQVQWALGQWHPGRVAIGVEGSYEALQPLIVRH